MHTFLFKCNILNGLYSVRISLLRISTRGLGSSDPKFLFITPSLTCRKQLLYKSTRVDSNQSFMMEFIEINENAWQTATKKRKLILSAEM